MAGMLVHHETRPYPGASPGHTRADLRITRAALREREAVMIKRQPADEGRVKLTFVVHEDQADGPVAVLGDFNGWDPKATVLRKRGPLRSGSITVESGRAYAFRYRRADGGWFDDETADWYEPNEYGGQNSVIDLTNIDSD